jgi:hypothetical protein
MVWYEFLSCVAGIFGVISFIFIIISILTGMDELAPFLIFLIAGAIALGAMFGCQKIEEQNTTISTEIAETIIEEKYITSTQGNSNYVRHHYLVAVGWNDRIFEVKENQYGHFNVGDTVSIKIEKTYLFGEQKTTKVSLIDPNE